MNTRVAPIAAPVSGKKISGTDGSGKNANRRRALRLGVMGFGALVLAGCKGIIPDGGNVPTTGPAPVEGPVAGQLPDMDEARHRIALLAPMSGENAAVGQSMANAANMALLDTNTANIRITSYDTARDPAGAARRAIADGNRLILGPLLGDNVDAVKGVAKPARVPIISFSNDSEVAGDGVYVMGQIPAQSIERTMIFAQQNGISRFGALVPSGEYGKRASDAMLATARRTGTQIAAIETYNRDNNSLTSAVRRLQENGDYQAILIADGARIAVRAGPLIRDADKMARILGTELWSGDAQIAQTPALRGAWFSAVSDARFQRLSDSYKSRFGSAPYRVSALGYDAVLLTIRIARDWQPGTAFPVSELNDRGGFLGLDGAFRFNDGVVQRAFEVREVTVNGMKVVSPAPTSFD